MEKSRVDGRRDGGEEEEARKRMKGAGLIEKPPEEVCNGKQQIN